MWMKRYKNGLAKFARAVVFCVGLVYILGVLSDVLILKSSKSKLEPFFEDKGKYDILFTGISHMMMGVYPLELWNEYGFVSFNLGESGNKLPNSYWTIRNALDYSDPKLIVVDVRRMELEKVELDDFAKPDYDRFPLSWTKYETARDLLADPEEQIEFLFPFIKYHSRWTELTKEDFTGPEYWIDKGAYHYPTEYLNVSVPVAYEHLPATEKQTGGTVSVAYLRRMIELCQEKNIEILLVELPYPADEENQRLANGVADIAEEYGVNYINFHHLDGIIDYNTDMNDADAHLNDSGAKKVTEYLGNYIAEHYQIPDRREDAAYSGWKETYEKYVQYKDERIREQTSLDNYLMLLADQNISCCIYSPAGSGMLQDSRMRALLQNVAWERQLEQIEEAADSDGEYFLVVDHQADAVYESISGQTIDADTGFGKVSFAADSSGGRHLHIGVEGTDYLSTEFLQEQTGKTPAGGDIVITVIDQHSGETIDTVSFSQSAPGVWNSPADRNS